MEGREEEEEEEEEEEAECVSEIGSWRAIGKQLM
jgi:hypothetical protein